MYRIQVEKLYDSITSRYSGARIINVFHISMSYLVSTVTMGKLLKTSES